MTGATTRMKQWPNHPGPLSPSRSLWSRPRRGAGPAWEPPRLRSAGKSRASISESIPESIAATALPTKPGSPPGLGRLTCCSGRPGEAGCSSSNWTSEELLSKAGFEKFRPLLHHARTLPYLAGSCQCLAKSLVRASMALKLTNCIGAPSRSTTRDLDFDFVPWQPSPDDPRPCTGWPKAMAVRDGRAHNTACYQQGSRAMRAS